MRKTRNADRIPRTEFPYHISFEPPRGLYLMIATSFSAAGERDVVPPLCPLAASPYDFSRVGEMIDPAAKSTRKKLARNGLKRQGGAND
jgi:hypothetical protein